MGKVKLGTLEIAGEDIEGLLEDLVEHVSIVDRQFNVLWGNKFARANFGDKLIGMKCYTAYHGRTDKCPECLVEKTYSDDRIHEHETMVTPEGGQPIYFHCNSYVLRRDEEGKPDVVVEISKVITDRIALGKDMDRMFKLTEDREQEMIRLKDRIEVLEQRNSEKPIATRRK